MIGSDETSGNAGLPWPEDYTDLRPQLREKWGVSGEIYLARKLSGGRSGALVYAADLDIGDFGGQAILKLDHYPESGDQPDEAAQHRLALQKSPDYAARHLPRLVNTYEHNGRVAILSTIAGRGLEYAEPWSQCSYGRQLETAHDLSRGLLEDWNSDHQIAEGLKTPHDLLQSWLDYRLDPVKGRIYSFMSRQHQLTPENPTFVVDGVWLPNPLTFVEARSQLPDHLRLRAAIGNTHGDLHGSNVLVASLPNANSNYFLIDLASYDTNHFLLFDHACFELTHLLRSRGQVNLSNWVSLLTSIEDSGQGGIAAQGDDVGLVELVKAIRTQVFEWIDRHESNRLAYMESQYLLARVAAGLSFAHKRLSEESRNMALLYAAANLKGYLQLNTVDWPKYGPPFALAAQSDRPTPIGLSPEPSVEVAPESGEPSNRSAPTDGMQLPEKPTIAILPFENLSGDVEQEYFAEGITEDLVTELSRVDWLMVISHRSSRSYKGREINVRLTGAELGAGYIVTGSARKSGAEIRVTAHLIDAKSDRQVWSESFDRTLEDVFATQDEIADAIVRGIDSEAKGSEREDARRKRGPLNAWELYQKGMWHFFRMNPKDDAIALDLMQQAFHLAPSFAEPQAMLSIIGSRNLLFGIASDPTKELEEALEWAGNAVAADNNCAIAHVAYARVLALSGDHDAAIDEVERAIKLNPSSAVGYIAYAGALYWNGRSSDALEKLTLAMRISPKDPMIFALNSIEALCHADLGNLTKAETLARAAVRAAPIGLFPRIALTIILVRQERIAEAREVVAELTRFFPGANQSAIAKTVGSMASAQREQLLADLRKAGLE